MNKKVVVLQEENSDCGVCSLLSIIKYYNGMANLEELRIDSNTTEDGVNAYNLINCAKKYGLDAKGLKVDNLNNRLLPCIAHFKLPNNLFHFVVIYSISNKSILIMDPSRGLTNIPIDIFNDYFTGFIIEMYPQSNLIKYQPKNTIRKIYQSFLSNNKMKLLILLILTIINLLLTIVSSYYIQLRINYNYSYLLYLFLIFELIKSLTSFKFEYRSKKLENSLSSKVHQSFLSFISKLPLNYIHLKKNGELIARFEELESIKEFFNSLIINFFLNTISIVLLLLLLVYYNFIILIPILLFMLISLFINIMFSKKLTKLVKNNIETNTNYKNELVDMISGLTSINHNSVTNYFNTKINNSYSEYLNSTLELTKESNTYKEIISFLSGSLIIVLNTILLKSLDETISIIFINYLILYLLNNYNSLINLIPIYYYIKSYLRKCNDLLDIDFKDSSIEKFIPGDIILKNVSYSYNRLNNVLNNINIVINNKSKIIFKGSSGSGKSTICKLLTKELNNYEGNILIGNHEVKEMNIKEINNNIYYSSQEEHIFFDTIRNNITLGNNISETQFQTIARICQLESIIHNRPFGYDTYLSGGGSLLSGGERERIILARSLCMDKNIYIYDETLSEVNPEMELEIVNALFDYLKDKTVIYITHKNLNYPGYLMNI